MKLLYTHEKFSLQLTNLANKLNVSIQIILQDLSFLL
ncbi:hypothetical protein B8A39_03140 [Dolosigranulum pigrum]|nr:HTH domain-containing protein [Dolosigranulum pigrum]RAN52574.1 hypothetical protein B8A39_03140 [Dolosigranulum pigrum]